MSKATTNDKRAFVPRLRFPEFRDGGEWVEQKLSEVLTEHGLKSTGEEEVFSVSVHKGLVNQIEHLGRSYSAANTDHYNRVIPGDIVYTKSPTGAFPLGVIKQSQMDCQVIVSPLYGVFTPESTAVGRLIDAYFSSPYNAKVFLGPIVNKGAKNTINVTNAAFLSKKLLLPKARQEQQKIADCLSSLDARIAAQADKIDALETHKKGLMQQLFPYDGETVPRLRFPEFRNAGDWVNRKVYQLLKKISDPVLVEGDKIYQELGIRSHGKGIFHKKPITGEMLRNKRVFWIKENTFIVNIVFAWELAVASTTSAEKGMIASHRFPMYGSTGNKADVRYMKYFFLTHKGKQLLRIASPGGAGRNRTLGQKDFENLDILIPEKLKEQKRIADCLSSLDVMITEQVKKLDALKAHRKGLMQQLFPSPEIVDA